MKIEKLVKHCLQYLEQDSDNNVMDLEIEDLLNDETFSEYTNNIESSIYAGLLRYAISDILPLKEISFENGSTNIDLVEKGTNKPICHNIQGVYSIDANGNINFEVKYVVIGTKIRLLEKNDSLEYVVVYNPTIHELEFYNEDIFKIELNDLGVPDEMAEMLRYFVYSDMKLEENPSVALQNKNIFEEYLTSCKRNQISINQVELPSNDECGWY